jgi:hypothetical protein
MAKKTIKAWINISDEGNVLRDTECDHYDVHPEQAAPWLIPCTITYELPKKPRRTKS